MPTFERSGIAAVLSRVVGGLATHLGLHESRVIVTALEFEHVPHHGAEREVLIGYADELPLPGREGGGRVVDMRRRVFQVGVRTRYLLDRADQDNLRLSRASIGHIATEDAVTDYLESLCVMDQTGPGGNQIALPLLCGEWSKPRRGRQQNETATGWLLSYCNCEVRYMRALTQDLRAVPTE